MPQASNESCNKLNFYIILGVVFAALYYLAPVLTPFLAGAFIAYLFNPLVQELTKHKVPRTLAVAVIFTLILSLIVGLIFLLVPLIQDQLLLIRKLLIHLAEKMQSTVFPWLMNNMGHDAIDTNALKTILTNSLAKTGSFITWLVGTLLHSSKALFETTINLVLIPLVAFYLLRDWNLVLNAIEKLVPKKYRPTFNKLARECDTVLSGFFRGQVLVMLVLGIYYAIGLSIVGLETGVIIGFVIGIVSIVPYAGVIIGLAIAATAWVLQTGSFTGLTYIAVVFLMGHILEGFILTPHLVGDRIGLHPVAVIFAILAGAALFGFFGVLLALPVAAVCMVLLRHLNGRYQASALYNDA